MDAYAKLKPNKAKLESCHYACVKHVSWSGLYLQMIFRD